jgi:polar amino acid transport system substrate-binding protein
MSFADLARRSALSALLVLAAIPARADDFSSTWQRIMQTKVLRLGFALSDPYAIKDLTNSPLPGGIRVGDTLWRGFAPVVGTMIADVLGVNAEFVESSDASSVAGLQANLIDMFVPVEGTPSRATAADFIPTPIMWFAMTYYSRSADAPTTWEGLNDPKYRIGVVLGAHSDTFVSAHAPKAQIQRFPDTNLQIAALQSGRVDGMVALGVTTNLAYGRLKMGKLVTPTPVDVSSTSVAIRQEADPRWHNFLTTTIGYYYTSGTIERIYDDILRFRGIDPKDVLPITRENWPQ